MSDSSPPDPSDSSDSSDPSAQPDASSPAAPPELGRDDVRKIAVLARLAVDDSELDGLVEHFSKMLHFVEHLADADDPSCDPFRLDPRSVNDLRPDTPIPSGNPGSPVPPSAWQPNAPATDGAYFTVPRVVGSEEQE